MRTLQNPYPILNIQDIRISVGTNPFIMPFYLDCLRHDRKNISITVYIKEGFTTILWNLYHLISKAFIGLMVFTAFFFCCFDSVDFSSLLQNHFQTFDKQRQAPLFRKSAFVTVLAAAVFYTCA